MNVSALTQEKVRLALAAAEAADIQAGTVFALHTEVSASILVTMGLDLEDQQYVHTFSSNAMGTSLISCQTTSGLR